MIVVDASVMLDVLLATDVGTRTAPRIMAAASRHVPHLFDAEVVQVLRRFVLTKQITPERAATAIEDLRAFQATRHGHAALVGRAFELRENLTVYDALYVALAEALGAPLLTRDGPVARAPGVRIAVDLCQ